MPTWVLIHGGGSTAASWNFVSEELKHNGHEVVAVDLPCDTPSATWDDYADTVVDAVGDRTDLIVVAHSVGGSTAPLVAERASTRLIVIVAGMVPVKGETFMQW